MEERRVEGEYTWGPGITRAVIPGLIVCQSLSVLSASLSVQSRQSL